MSKFFEAINEAKTLPLIVKSNISDPMGGESSIEKGIIDELNYGSKNSTTSIEKTGKELKVKFALIKASNEAKLEGINSALNLLEEKIGAAPDIICDDYELKSLPAELQTELKTYSYQKITPCCSEIMDSGGSSVSSNDIESFKSQYRSLIYSKINLLCENAQINTFINNIPDNRKIDISLRLATSLGF